MAGSSEAHVEIVGRLYALLFGRLYARGCKVYTNDMRVQADQWSSYTYPDVVVACGRRRAFAMTSIQTRSPTRPPAL